MEDATSALAATAVGLAYSSLSGLSCGSTIGTPLGSGQVLTPNVYCLIAASILTGDLTLNGQGDCNALFIFKINGAFSTGTYSNVLLINGAQAKNVYWQITGAFTLGDYSVFRGTVVVGGAGGGAINLNTGATLYGRALTTAGAINLYAITATITQNLWKGGGTVDWNTASNWIPGVVPSCSLAINAEIPNGATPYPVISSTGNYADNLIIQSGATLTVNPGKDLTVCGCTEMNGSDALILKSDATGTASFIDNGLSGTGTAKVERYLSQDAWHLISAPISDALSGIFVGQYLKPYIESTNLWGDYIIPLTTALPAGVGFVCWPVTSQAYTFTGTLNTGTVTPDLTWTDINHGNNLVGNPYPSAIDWNASSGWTKTNLGLSIWVWNPNGNYAVWDGTNTTNGGSRYIAVGQGFFVQATSASPVLSMNDDVRVHNTQAFLKNSDPEDALKLHIENSKGSDEIVVCFNPSSSWTYNPNIDSRKMFGDAVAPQLFSFKPGDPEELSINVLPEIKNPLVVPVSLKVGLNGQYSITASQMESFPANVSLYLEDLKLGKVQDLRVNPGYTFSADTNDIDHRFNLHFSNFPFGIPGTANDNTFQIYSYEQTIYVKSTIGLNKDARIYVYDALGRTLYQSAFSVISLNKFDLNLSHGNYIVKVLANSGVYTQKIFID